jgi:hypothetical protein
MRWFTAAVSVIAAVAALGGQDYSIDWSSVDGGGGTSTGGVYAVSGTIGQPDAGSMSGGIYQLDGGFWSMISVVQMPGAPLLAIYPTRTNAVFLVWPSPSTGYSLQQSADANTTNWVSVAQTPIDNGTAKSIVVNPSSGRRFYRLVK